MRFIFLACNYLPSFPDTAGGEGNTAIKREQSQTCLNYAEQEQGKADIVGLILHSTAHLAHSPEDAHRCCAAGHDVGELAKVHNVE